MIEIGPLTLVSPPGMLVGLVAVVPLAALAAVVRRARGVRSAIGLEEPPPTWRPALAGIAAVAVLVGLAAAQPVWANSRTQHVRTDAEVFVVFDTSRSMLASLGPAGATRLDRAKERALALRARFPDVPVGVASMTDRTLPHLFPSADGNAFRATVDRAIGIEQPPPQAYFKTIGTTFAALSTVATRGFFSTAATRRVLVVYTDGESRPFDAAGLGVVLRRGVRIHLLFVHVWNAKELVYANGVPERDYRSNPKSTTILARAASQAGEAVYGEDDLAGLSASARRDLGSGPTTTASPTRDQLAIGPFLILAAALPLLVPVVRLAR